MTASTAIRNVTGFVFLGIPGLAICVCGGVLLFTVSSAISSMGLMWGVGFGLVSALAFLGGSLIALVGVGRWREPLYLFVFWSFPVSAALGFRAADPKAGFALAVATIPVATYIAVREYYRRYPDDSRGP